MEGEEYMYVVEQAPEGNWEPSIGRRLITTLVFVLVLGVYFPLSCQSFATLLSLNRSKKSKNQQRVLDNPIGRFRRE